MNKNGQKSFSTNFALLNWTEVWCLSNFNIILLCGTDLNLLKEQSTSKIVALHWHRRGQRIFVRTDDWGSVNDIVFRAELAVVMETAARKMKHSIHHQAEGHLAILSCSEEPHKR